MSCDFVQGKSTRVDHYAMYLDLFSFGHTQSARVIFSITLVIWYFSRAG